MNYLITLFTILLLSCGIFSCRTHHDYECIKSLEDKYPESIIFQIPNNLYAFIVCDTFNNVYYIETKNFDNTNITKKIIIKKN
jgi:hypothetical protein